jgi:GT2 family glycosyltransferase
MCISVLVLCIILLRSPQATAVVGLIERRTCNSDPPETLGKMDGISDDAPLPVRLSVSLVTFHSDSKVLRQTLDSLRKALEIACDLDVAMRFKVTLIDNGGDFVDGCFPSDFGPTCATDLMTGHGNVGYGAGHNLAISAADSDFHLVLNPDVRLDSRSLVAALSYMRAHPAVGLIAPRTHDRDGNVQFLCRRYPRALDLAVRGFVPRDMRRPFEKRLAHYELREEVISSNATGEPFDPPFVSGCFMFFRTDVLKTVGGFDPAYFLYFEDYDLCMRVASRSQIAYVPSVMIVHYGGGAVRKGARHIAMFVRSASRFYRTWGLAI